MSNKEVKSILDIDGGIVDELFSREWEKVMENISNDNIPAKDAREITIKIKVIPNERRQYAETHVEADSKLAKYKKKDSAIMLSFDGRKTTAFSNDPKQMELGEDIPQNVIDGSKEFLKGAQ